MATMNISLPDSLKNWVDSLSSGEGDYASASDYVRDLIRKDQEQRQKIARLQIMVDEAMASGASPYSFPEIREMARDRARKNPLG